MRNQTTQDVAKSLKTRLANYKKFQEKKARAEGKYDQLMACTTLTQARKVVYGAKTKNNSGWRGWTVDGQMPGGRSR